MERCDCHIWRVEGISSLCVYLYFVLVRQHVYHLVTAVEAGDILKRGVEGIG